MNILTLNHGQVSQLRRFRCRTWAAILPCYVFRIGGAAIDAREPQSPALSIKRDVSMPGLGSWLGIHNQNPRRNIP